MFPPITDMPRRVTPSPSPPYGFTISSVPDGAYVASVVNGSPADNAGLKQGMVLAQLNGLSLKGLAVATIDQVLAAADGVVTVSVIGGATLRIVRMPAMAATPAQVTPYVEPVRPGPEDRF